MARKVLIVEDDNNIAELLHLYLEKEGFETVCAYTGDEALSKFREENPDLIILDLMLPETDGWQVCREIRKTSQVPIFMLTAKSDTFDKVLGLELGADDYMTKPFGVMELISRVKALLRRSQNDSVDDTVYNFAGIVLDNEKHQVTVNGEACELTYKEYELLKLFMMNIGVVIPRERILERIWGTDFEGESRTIDMHIKNLRQKLKVSGKYIKTIRNVGYVMNID